MAQHSKSNGRFLPSRWVTRYDVRTYLGEDFGELPLGLVLPDHSGHEEVVELAARRLPQRRVLPADGLQHRAPRHPVGVPIHNHLKD